MGGCRCSYRNCSARSDGKTHMFHYPVMDKIRCHQWLTNARRLDFLNLTVSQLKNRVVCQHHFKDENFMNYKKDKLIFDAIPTEDGPFCDPIKSENEKDNKTPSISIEDIENEVIMRRNLVNLAMKYGDFLTTSDLMETLIINDNNKMPLTLNEYDTMHTKNDVKIHIPTLVDTKQFMRSIPPTIINKHDKEQIQSQQINLEDFSLNNKPLIKSITILPTNVTNPSLVNKPVINKHKEESGIMQSLHSNKQETIDVINENVTNKPKNNLQNKNNTNHKKIRILSEKTISEPLVIKGKLEPVPASLDLSEFTKNEEIKLENTSSVNNYKIRHIDEEETKSKLETIKVGEINSSPPMVEKQYTKATKIDQQQNVNNNTQQHTKASKIDQKQNVNNNTLKLENKESKTAQVFKFKMPAERYAAIQEKRKFNMKLKDIIEVSLNNLEKQETCNNNNVVSICDSKQKDASKKVGSFLSRETELPSISNYTIASLEARMKRMENILINKIDQNSQRIVELKNSLQVDKKKTESIAVQTPVNEEAHKRYLFQEISKYLSPDASSLIYEELFINKYTNSVTQCASGSKRRKFR